MIEELTSAINAYKTAWDAFISEQTGASKKLLIDARPTAAAWKVFDRADFDETCHQLRDQSDQVHYGWVNERWLATFHLKGAVLPLGLKVVKVMERRPGSTDAVGLDHLDFYTKEDVKKTVSKGATIKWTEESNGAHCTWISVWFGAHHEAKLRRDTVLKVCANELLEYEQAIIAGS